MINRKIMALLLSLVLIVSLVPFAAITVSAESKVYYVAADGNDSNSGFSADAPLSLAAINEITLYGGDTVLFKRGDIFYGLFNPIVENTSDESRVEVGAYGNGDLPILSGAKIISKAWEDAGNGFYKMDLSNEENFKGISNELLAAKDIANVGFFETVDGKIYGERKRDAESCDTKNDFYCDETSIYIKTDKDPYSEFGELTLAIHACLIRLNKGVNIRNLHLQHSGYGICWKSNLSKEDAKFSDITDCVIEKIGGTVIDVENFTRAGNGIEFYNRGESVIIKNNIFRHIYDVAFTCQGNGWEVEKIENEDGSTTVINETIWNNITVTNNVFAYCTQAFEIWSKGKSEASGITNLDFTNNLCIGQGEGWTYSFRSNGALNHAVTDILAYGFYPETLQMNLTGNTYFHSKQNIVSFALNNYSHEKFNAARSVVADYNNYYNLSNDSAFFLKVISGIDVISTMNFKEWQANFAQDINSTFNAVGDKLYKFEGMQTVAKNSYNFNDIVEAAVDAGLTVNTEYDATATTTTALESNISVSELSGGELTANAALQGDYCTVTVTVTPDSGKVLKADGLKYTYGGNTYPIVTRVDAANDDGSFNTDSESQYTAFKFNLANNAENVIISAEFVDKGAENIAVIGTSVNKSLVSMRFRSRTDRSITVNGKEYSIKSCGTLLFKEAQTDLEATWEGIAYGTVNGKNIKTTQLYDRTDNYYEYVCHINYGTSNSEFLDDAYYAYAYAVYENDSGDTVRIYSDLVAHSYQDVAATSNNVIA